MVVDFGNATQQYIESRRKRKTDSGIKGRQASEDQSYNQLGFNID